MKIVSKGGETKIIIHTEEGRILLHVFCIMKVGRQLGCRDVRLNISEWHSGFFSPQTFWKYSGIYGNIWDQHLKDPRNVFLQFHSVFLTVSSCHVI